MTAQEGFTVREASRQIGVSEATIRGWMKTGKLPPLTASKPVALERSAVLRARAEALAQFDSVVDLQVDRRDGPSAREERLRSVLRAVLASVESFDAGFQQLRASQRLLLDTLLNDLSDLDRYDWGGGSDQTSVRTH